MSMVPAVKAPPTSPAVGLTRYLGGQRQTFEAIVAKGYDVDRLLRMAVLAAEKQPDLYSCDPKSMLASVAEAARLGLDVGGVTGEAYLIPQRVKDRKLVQLRVGYKGLIRLAERGGKVFRIQSEAVYANDHFEFWRDEAGDHYLHRPQLTGDRGTMLGCYAVAHLTDGKVQAEWMSIEELKAIQERSASGDSGPWVTDFAEMAKKTVVIRLAKDLPISPDAQRAAQLENMAESGKALDLNEHAQDVEVVG